MRQKRKEKITDIIHERLLRAWLIKVKVPCKHFPIVQLYVLTTPIYLQLLPLVLQEIGTMLWLS